VADARASGLLAKKRGDLIINERRAGGIRAGTSDTGEGVRESRAPVVVLSERAAAPGDKNIDFGIGKKGSPSAR